MHSSKTATGQRYRHAICEWRLRSITGRLTLRSSQKSSRFSHINFIETRIADERPAATAATDGRAGEERRGGAGQRRKRGAFGIISSKSAPRAALNCARTPSFHHGPTRGRGRPRLAGRAIIYKYNTGRPAVRTKDRAASQPAKVARRRRRSPTHRQRETNR